MGITLGVHREGQALWYVAETRAGLQPSRSLAEKLLAHTTEPDPLARSSGSVFGLDQQYDCRTGYGSDPMGSGWVALI